MENKVFIDTFECAKFLNLSVSKVRKLTMNRDIPFYKISRNKCLFKVEDLKKWVEAKFVPVEKKLSPRRKENIVKFFNAKQS